MSVFTYLKRKPLKQMIALLFTVFSLLPMLAMNIFAYKTASEQAEARMETQVEQTAQHVNSDLNMVISEASRLLNFTSSYTISNFFNSKTADARYENAKAVGEVFTNIRQTQSSNSYILDMSAIGINGHCFSERNGYFMLDKPFDSYDQFQIVTAEPRSVHVQGVSQSLCGRTWEEDTLTVSAAVFKIGTNEISGILRVTVSKSFIADILKSAQPCESGHTLVVDRDGSNLFADDESASLPKEIMQEIVDSRISKGTVDGNDSLIVYSGLPSTGWTIVSVAPKNDIFKAVYRIRVSAIVMTLASCLFIAVINILLSNYIAQPILRLKRLMQEAASGNLDIEIPKIDGQVEIMELYHNFDVMLSEIKNLLNRLVDEQKNLKKSELRALQSQINPHFLYNTLDSAVWAAESNKTDEVIDLIASLSDFYRLTLRSGMDVISFDTEISHVSCYLHIMQMRYQDILEYRIEVASDTLCGKFPKIILQPIVENAIYHGIKNKRYPKGVRGLIVIGARKTDGQSFEITVSDTGIGMDSGALADLQKRIQEGILRSGQSYGLINIDMRLRLMFGDDYRLQIQSRPNEGTAVAIRVPFIEEENHEV